MGKITPSVSSVQMLSNSSVENRGVQQLSSVLLSHNHRTSPRINKQNYHSHLCREQFNPHLDPPCGGCRMAVVTREHDPGSLNQAEPTQELPSSKSTFNSQTLVFTEGRGLFRVNTNFGYPPVDCRSAVCAL